MGAQVAQMMMGVVDTVMAGRISAVDLAGIALGEMIVTTGAYQVRLASLSGGDFAGGHAH